MPKKTKDEFASLLTTLSDADRADLFSLWDDIAERETKIIDLTKKVKDADEVIANASLVEKERNDLKTQKLELETKLAALTGKNTDEIELSAFSPLFDLFK